MNDMDELSVQYIRLRQKREILKERFTAEDGELEKAMAEIEAQLLDTLNASNSNSMSTNSAVIIRTVRKRYMPSNWAGSRGGSCVAVSDCGKLSGERSMDALSGTLTAPTGAS